MSAKAGPSTGRSSASGSKPGRQSGKRAPPSASSSDDSGSETDSSEDVTEDEDGMDLTPALDAAILRTLAKIRNKRGVYEGENVLADELKEAEEKVIKAGIKAMPNRRDEIKKYTLADHHRAALLNGKAGAEVEEEEEDEKPLTHVQSQYKLRNEAVSAFKALADDDDSDDEAGGDLLTRREKDEEEADEDDEEYRRFLLEMGGGEAEVRKILGMGEHSVPAVRLDEEDSTGTLQQQDGPEASEKDLRKQKKKAAKRQERKAKEDDDFLMNYILNRGWIDRSEEHVPTYEEIVGRPRNAANADVKIEEDEDDEEVPTAGPSHPWGELDEEDEFDEKAEEFENAYNFRFEEPGSTEILTHPREIPSLVRRTDDTRATKRAAKAERKAAEKAAKEEEARRIKGEKRREMEKQMASLRKDLGIDDDGAGGGVDWDELEKVMDGDFDEAEWERVVGKMLEAQRDKEDDDEDDGNEKPEWDDDVVEIDYEDADDDDVAMHMSFGGGAEQHDEEEEQDGPFNMDADFEDGSAPTKKKRREDKKGKNKAEQHDAGGSAAAIAEEAEEEEEGLTVADKAKRVKKAMDEYKALDHEDMIGDMPTRFKYTKSKSTAFGLTPAEILLATDKELDAIAGLKHIAPYRKHGLGMQGRGISKRIYDLKQRLKLRKWGEEVDEDSASTQRGKGKERERQRDSGWSNPGQGQKRKADTDPDTQGPGGEQGGAKKKRMGKKQRQKAAAAAASAGDTTNVTGSAPSGNRYEGMDPTSQSAPAAGQGEEGGKAKRRKKKGGDKRKPEDLQIFD